MPRESNESKVYTVEVFTDGRKSDEGVGSGIVMFINNIPVYQMQYKLGNGCSNNQSEQFAIMKALEKMEELQDLQRTTVIHTDSRITLDSLKNSKNHNFLLEEMRQKIRILHSRNWSIDFGWVKAHTGIHGNELADRLAKQAARIQKQ
jgi:ribonuclease HI